ncbi:hypothetical protein [Vibrio owensii]|uniref:hypothetical protein n=1 Tax=Vibrio harveyi group TaxID=717610 RepID=UPI003CC67AE8
MGKSYNKVLGFRDRNPYMKKIANRRFRRNQKYMDIANGKAYRKVTNPWDICDWSFNFYSISELTAYCRRDWERYAYLREDYKNFDSYLSKEIARNRCK